MKRLIPLLYGLIISISLFSQNRICRSIVNFTQMQIQNPSRYQRFMDLETFIQNYIANQNNSNRVHPNLAIKLLLKLFHLTKPTVNVSLRISTQNYFSDAQQENQNRPGKNNFSLSPKQFHSDFYQILLSDLRLV